ncbi:MAG: sugar ABC transporter ATP-binding protein [Thermogemmatispora sp.]|jgi:ribose transport system ATP-binding protein|uniref:sugar ABC transporter ATP-binding protein n=1 Tax=Thermogemmatispora TaxID=768669 RepID=UPI0012786F72|nr:MULTISPECIES: sugar ABC transporter ATP-binding protein [Thermogemmatispora]MBE3564558.1 sugar ABC transporter ATP-binding protein [Thermogemmatispora sp.]GER84210.1 putative ribose/galactose/methyl galactoside import ATP-binding protein 1 [Thermogemmatispora aurantia]
MPSTSMETEQSPIIRLRKITRRFPGVTAVAEVDLDIYPGEVHVVAGENGAGKSTLMRILYQVERPDAGQIYLNGEPLSFHGPHYARALGVAMVHQEFALAPHLSVAENLFLGREPLRFGFIRRRRELAEARRLLEQVGLDLDPRRLVASLSVAEQQLVEIARAISFNARVLILDEPTATLTEQEIARLFEVIRQLTAQGVAVLYISHRLDEIFQIADRVTVMRDGRVVATLPLAELSEQKLVQLMVGRAITNLYPRPETHPGPVLLRVEGLSRRGLLHDCSFEVHAGEILGLAGLIGAGRSELARAVCGADPIDSGRILLDGHELHIRRPADAIRAGLAYVTEDRKREGLALDLGVDQNITLASLPARLGLLLLRRERSVALHACQRLNIRTPSVRRKVRLLSGGNQQKVVVARWLETQARVIFFDEPARGIDVGAKAEMFALIGRLASEGRAIVLISSYLPELLNMCDRIAVMREGRIVGTLSRGQFSEERIIALATGASEVTIP